MALLPALVGAFAVSYSGMAASNAVWHLMFDHDVPALLMVVSGLVYGLGVGVLIPIFVFGTAARLIWPRAVSGRPAPRAVAAWLGLQILTLPLALGLTFAAYGLPWLLLTAR